MRASVNPVRELCLVVGVYPLLVLGDNPTMADKKYRIHIRKDALKFSSAHMTVFSDGTKEALHGHNYRSELAVDVSDASLSKMLPFHHFKAAMKSICEAWDEKVLLPSRCPFLKVLQKSATEVEFVLCGKRYVLPADECVFLDVDNVTTETLAEQFCVLLVGKLSAQVSWATVQQLEVRIEEITGQGASFFWMPS